MSSDPGHDYYDPHPYAAPTRPVVLLGQPGSGVAAVARALSGLTGWTFNHIDRLVEGRAGRSRARIAVEEGIEALAALERDAFRQAVERTPAGVVAGDPIGLADAEARAWIAARALVVHVARPGAYLLQRIARETESAPGSLPDFLLAVPCQVDDLMRHLAERSAVLASAEWTHDAGERAPLTVAGLRAALEPRLHST